MIRLIATILITTLALTSNIQAGADGDLILKKNKPSEIKDCSEKFNRATFAFNKALDGIVFKPVASVYRTLPKPFRKGVSLTLIHNSEPTRHHDIYLMTSSA